MNSMTASELAKKWADRDAAREAATDLRHEAELRMDRMRIALRHIDPGMYLWVIDQPEVVQAYAAMTINGTYSYVEGVFQAALAIEEYCRVVGVVLAKAQTLPQFSTRPVSSRLRAI